MVMRPAKQWFDGDTVEAHARDALHLAVRLALLVTSVGCA